MTKEAGQAAGGEVTTGTGAGAKRVRRSKVKLTWDEGIALKTAVDANPELGAIIAKFPDFDIESPF